MMRAVLFRSAICVSLALTLVNSQALAGSCCVTSSGMGPVLMGVEAAKIQSTISNSNTLFQAADNNAWNRAEQQSTQSFSLEGAYRIKEIYQVGISTKFISQLSEEKSAKVGDTILNFGLGDSERVLFFQMTAPTGTSIYDSTDPQSLYTGQGFWRAGFGAGLSKHNFFEDVPLEYDYSASVLVAEGLKKDTVYGEADPRAAISVTASAGLRLKSYRMATSLAQENDPGVFDQGERRVTTLSIAFTKKLNETDALQLSLADQTQIGSPTNSPLKRMIGLNLSRVWF